EAYETALSGAGVSYVVRGGERFFSRRDVRTAVAALRKAARRGGDGDALVPATRSVLREVGLSATPPPPGALRGRWEALAALVSVAEELAAVSPDADLPRLVAEIDERAAAHHAPAVEGVTLASLHAAKGLEWDAVFLVGLTDGMVPIQHAGSPAAV